MPAFCPGRDAGRDFNLTEYLCRKSPRASPSSEESVTFVCMVHNELMIGHEVISRDEFPELMAPALFADSGELFYQFRHPAFRSRLRERRFPRFTLLRQCVESREACVFKGHSEGEPMMVLSFYRSGEVLRRRNGERLCRTGDVHLSILPQEVTAVDCFGKDTRVEIGNILLPEHFVRRLNERHNGALETFCRCFDREEPASFCGENRTAGRRLMRALNDIEHCEAMGNYAEKYLEEKILDCLSIQMNGIRGCHDQLHPVNLVLSGKIHDACHIVHARFQSPPSLHELASLVGTNECTLKSAFKQEFGITVFQYLFEYRMRLAVRYLLDSSLPVAAVGAALGYDYQSHFCTAFRRKFGVSPSEFRNSRGMAPTGKSSSSCRF